MNIGFLKQGAVSNRTLAILAGLVVVLIVAAVLAFAHEARKAAHDEQYVLRAGEQRVLAQRIAKYAPAAARGEPAAFARLGEARERYAVIARELAEGDPASGLVAVPEELAGEWRAAEERWDELRAPVDAILAGEAPLLALDVGGAAIAGQVPALAAAAERVARQLLETGASTRQVYLAARQVMLAQRIGAAAARVQRGGTATKAPIDDLARDAAAFAGVLAALADGSTRLEVERVVDPVARRDLAEVSEAFAAVESQVGRVVEAGTAALPALAAAAEVGPASERLDDALAALVDTFGTSPGRLGLGPLRIGPAAVVLLGLLAALLLMFLGGLLLRDARRREQDSIEQYQRNQEAIRRLLDEMGDLADGDLTVEATVTEDITGAIADSVNYAIEAMRGLVFTINETAVKVSASAQDSRATALHLAEAAEHQREQISGATGIVRAMSDAMDRMAADAAESAEVAQRSVEIAARGGDTVRRTIAGMSNIREQIQETAKRIKRLGESSQEIGNIVELIEDIADQTNILALNAAMQAAMAGEAGRGFAVVADEVQRLAERSSNATKQIEALVKTIQADTNEAVSSMEASTTEVVGGAKLAEAAGDALQEIEQVSNRIADITRNIADSAQRQSREASNINDTMSVIQEITGQTTEGTEQTAVSIGRLADLADELRHSVAGFRLPEDD
jgi:twitching motility protein PilJ